MRRLGIAALTLVFVAGCSNHRGPTRNRTIERQWSDASIQKIDLSGINGRVVLEPSPDATIHMTAQMELGASLPAADDEKLIKIRQEGSTLFIEDEGGPQQSGFLSFLKHDSVKIDFTLKVPMNLALELQTVNGSIRVEGVGSQLQVTSVNGKIEARSPAHEIEAETVNGSVRIEYMSEFRGGKFNTVNGSINVSVPANTSIDADVNQLNGSFQSNIPVIVEGDSVKSADGGVNRFPLDVSTVNGSVTLTQRTAAQATTAVQ